MGLYLFDFETTGVNPLVDRPVQIAAISVLPQNVFTVMNTLCHPRMPISEEASKVHGITLNEVEFSPAYDTAVWQLLATIGDSASILGGYNVSMFDVPMLTHIIKPWFDFEVLDILDVVYRRRPLLPSKKLGDVYEALMGKKLEGAHGAIQDCYGSLAVLDAICREDGVSYEDLAEEQKTSKPYSILPIGKYTGTPLDQIPCSWAFYMHKNAQSMRPDLKATVDYVLEKNRDRRSP